MKKYLKKSFKMKNIVVLILLVFAGLSMACGTDGFVSMGFSEPLAQLLGSGTPGTVLSYAYAVTTEQTGLVIAYKNGLMIAAKASPIVDSLSTHLNFKWFKQSIGNAFSVPDTQIGRRSRPNEVFYNGEDMEGLAKPFGLEHSVPQEDINEAGPRLPNYVNRKLIALMDKVLLGREIRIALQTQLASNYNPNQVHATAAGDKFTASTSHPLKYLRASLKNARIRPNVIGFNADGWEAFCTHPDVVSAANANSGQSGVATKERVAQLLEVREVVVGSGWVNTAKIGQTPVLTPCWGNHVWAHFDDPIADQQDGLAFARSVQVGDRVAEAYETKETGLLGGFMLKAGFYHGDVILNNDCGVLFPDVV